MTYIGHSSVCTIFSVLGSACSTSAGCLMTIKSLSWEFRQSADGCTTPVPKPSAELQYVSTVPSFFSKLTLLRTRLLHGTVSLQANFIAFLLVVVPEMFQYMIWLICTADVYNVKKKKHNLQVNVHVLLLWNTSKIKMDETKWWSLRALPDFDKLWGSHSRTDLWLWGLQHLPSLHFGNGLHEHNQNLPIQKAPQSEKREGGGK